jgi:alkylated DNA repair protein alkB family protein 6
MVATPSDTATRDAQPIAAIPLAHLLVLPRSLLILSSSVYTSHLHGISPRTSDRVSAKSGMTETVESDVCVISNAELLGDAAFVDNLLAGSQWERARGVRTSLTFRHAERVLRGGPFGLAKGVLRRG